MERGTLQASKSGIPKLLKLYGERKLIFATSNSIERLSKPLLSIFTVLEIPEYTYPEFEDISTRIVKIVSSTIIQIGSSVWKSGSRDVMDVVNTAK